MSKRVELVHCMLERSTTVDQQKELMNAKKKEKKKDLIASTYRI